VGSGRVPTFTSARPGTPLEDAKGRLTGLGREYRQAHAGLGEMDDRRMAKLVSNRVAALNPFEARR
jgi:hypothetical protein